MQVQLTQLTEQILRDQLSGGTFSTAPEALEAMAVHWRHTAGQTATFPEHLEVGELARAQGVGPVGNPHDLVADFWRPDEDIDTFLSEVRQLRREGAPRERS
jgi:hypothetical protein